MSRTYTISQLARELGLTPRAIRFYEDKGMIAPARLGQARVFNQRDRVRLALIVRGKRVGFSLSEIREIIDLYDLGDGQLTQLRVAVGKFRHRIELLKQQRNEIDRAIEDLTTACAKAEERLAQQKEPADVALIGYGLQPSSDVGASR